MFLLLLLLFMYVVGQGSAASWLWWNTQSTISKNRASLLASIASTQKWINARQAQQQAGRLSDVDAQNLQAYVVSLVSLQQQAMTQIQLNVSLPKTVFDAVVLPWSSTPSGAIVYSTPIASGSGGAVSGTLTIQPYLAPSEIWTDAMFRSLLGPGAAYARVFVAWVVAGVISIIVFPITFAVFPITLRRSKVRWLHLLRPSIYGLAMVIVMLTIECLAVMIEDLIGSQYTVRTPLRVAQFGPPFITFVWWCAAMKSYMKLPSPMVHAAILTLLNMLLAVVILWYVAPWSEFL